MFADKSDDAFNLSRPVPRNTSLRDYQYYSYEARVPNQPGRIELQVQDTSRYFLPAEAFIEVVGRLSKKADDTAYDDDDKVGFVNNGIMALFKSAIYMIDGKEIENIQDNVDVATTIIGLAKYSDDYTRTAGPTMMFAKDITDYPDHINMTMGNVTGPKRGADISAVVSINNRHNVGFAARRSMLNANGEFSSVIPLSHIFGFCRGVRKVIFGAKHTVVLVRKGDANDAIWRDPATDPGKVELTKLALWMPVMSPPISEEQKLLSFMDTGGKLLLSWHTTTTDSLEQNSSGNFTWHISSQQEVSPPRHIFIAFQSLARVNRQEGNLMAFDTLRVSEVSLRINGHQNPSEDIKIDFDTNNVARAYQRLMSFNGKELNVDTGLQISQKDFTSLYPIYYFSL